MKPMPSNLVAEQEILGAILNSNNVFCEVCEILKVEDFYNTKHQILYGIISKLFQEGKEITINNIVMELGSNMQGITITYLSNLTAAIITTATVVSNAKIVKDLSKRRKVIRQSQVLLQGIYDTKNNLGQLLGTFEDEITFAEDKSNIWTMDQTMSATLETVKSNYNNGGKVVGMETGLTTLDRALNGFQKGDLIVVAGRPSMGKTVFSLNLAERLSRKYGIYYASLEMRKEKLGMRLLAAKSKINSLQISTGNITDNDWTRIAQDTSLLANNKLYIDDSSDLTMMDIKSRCKRLKMQKDKGLDIIIIDHIGLLTPHTKRATRDLEIRDISRMGKIIAKELDCTVIFLSQLSRAPEQRTDHRPVLADLRESGNIEQDADAVAMLYRDEYYNKESEDKGILEVIIRKSRDGQLGTVKLAYLEQYQFVGELDLVH